MYLSKITLPYTVHLELCKSRSHAREDGLYKSLIHCDKLSLNLDLDNAAF